jgi:hypothetical protein
VQRQKPKKMDKSSVTKTIAKLGLYALICCDASQALGTMLLRTPYRTDQTSTLLASERTYGAAPIKDVIDVEGAMASFFESREEWLPAFRSIAGSSMSEDTAALLASLGQDNVGIPDAAIDFHEESSPWRRSRAIPQDEEERQVLAKFLDAMQASLLAIPVNEVANPETDPDDENDLQFVEEGRRLLALGRFQVLRAIQGGSVESVDSLFAHCWSEVMELSQTGTAHSGSLILVPEYDFSDLRRFVDMNLVKPLEWLGVQSDFEVVSLQRDSPAIRLIYKLNAIPTGTYTEEEGFAASE